eukprot:CAMPEP_0205919676 /NCGR_PEP_ID=MMETSP1325-20131115/10590_1 /ASSEMBLY_ACC=CAM_ASM_000708 /TAXON_ID=236786 /ORGANISM="Florenciella sp., Strain RCC1007" /LENGTH=47 /DNA_ID= /DNA_START= /DNA_END= /DNA_ORIENTATION=
MYSARGGGLTVRSRDAGVGQRQGEVGGSSGGGSGGGGNFRVGDKIEA